MSYTEIEMRRLMAWVYPSRTERALGAVVSAAYLLADTGPIAWIGNRADDTIHRLVDRRCRRGQHLRYAKRSVQ
jgi:hypothetical protein